MWGLGITFFEILVGRTPFEHVNGEALTTKGHLERYWSRTVCFFVHAGLAKNAEDACHLASGQVGRELEDVKARGKAAQTDDNSPC